MSQATPQAPSRLEGGRHRTLFALVSAIVAVLALLITPPVTPPASAAAPVPPTQPGAYKVGTYEFLYWTGGPGFQNARVSYPATSDGWLKPADKSEGTYPVVALAPASWVGFDYFDWITGYLTSHGYIVLSYYPPNLLSTDPYMHTANIKAAIGKVISENGTWGSPIRGIVATDKVAAAGVSLGGAGALAAAAQDSRIDAVVALTPGYDPADTGTYDKVEADVRTIRVPALIESGQNDCISPGAGKRYYNDVPGAYKQYVEIAGANHVQFLDDQGVSVPIPGVPEDCDAGVAYDAQHRTADVYATAFLEYFLKGRTQFGTYLFGDHAQADRASGVLSDLLVRQ
jgi:predicted dienelactone hydrolase